MKVLEIEQLTPLGRHAWVKAEIGGDIRRLRMETGRARKLLGIRDNSDDIFAKVNRISWWDRLMFWFRTTFTSKKSGI